MDPMGYNRVLITMKKIAVLFLMSAIVAFLCFTSCKKSPEKMIIGKWKVVSARCTSNVDEESEEAIEADKGEIWTFKENGTFYGFMNLFPNWGLNNGDIECDYSCDDKSIELRNGDLKGTIHDWDDTGQWSVVYMFDIDDMTDKDLTISGTMKCTLRWDDGESDNTTISLKYELEKK